VRQTAVLVSGIIINSQNTSCIKNICDFLRFFMLVFYNSCFSISTKEVLISLELPLNYTCFPIVPECSLALLFAANFIFPYFYKKFDFFSSAYYNKNIQRAKERNVWQILI